jgi:hypothetical protein
MQRQIGQRLPENGGGGADRHAPFGRGALVLRGGQQADAHEQRLLQNQDEGGRQDIGRIAGLRVEQRHRAQWQRIGGGHGDSRIGPGADQTGRLHLGSEGVYGSGDSAGHP